VPIYAHMLALGAGPIDGDRLAYLLMGWAPHASVELQESFVFYHVSEQVYLFPQQPAATRHEVAHFLVGPTEI